MPFPNFPQLVESTLELADGIASSRQTNGALRTQKLYPGEEARMVIVHVLTTAQWATLWSHYTTNRFSQDTIVWRETGDTYTVRYSKAPQRRRVGVGMWRVSFEVMEV